jgi:diguanylate cyclase (GGDEF)-like protein
LASASQNAVNPGPPDSIAVIRFTDSVTVKLGLSVAVTTLIAFASVLVIVIAQEEMQFTERRLNDARRITSSTSVNLATGMLAGGGEKVWDSVSAKAAQYADISGALRVLVLNSEGIVRAGSESLALGKRIDPNVAADCVGCDSDAAESYPMHAIVASGDSRQLRVVERVPSELACQGCHGLEKKTLGYIVAEFDLAPLDAGDRQRRRAIAVIGLIATVALLAMTALLFRRLVARPVRDLIGSLNRLAGGHLAERADDIAGGELGLLAHHFNRMAESIETQVAQIKAAGSESALLYSLVVEASKNLEAEEFAKGVCRVIGSSLQARYVGFFLEPEFGGWIFFSTGGQEAVSSGKEELQPALDGQTAQVRQLLAGFPTEIIAQVCRTNEIRLVRDGSEARFALPIVSASRLIGLIACNGISNSIHLNQNLLANFAAHLTLATSNSRNYGGAITDALTRLKNKRYGLARLTEAVAAARRNKSKLALAMCDIDHFKRVNDAHGHPAGDAVLREVAHRIVAAVRASDIVARYGGEEFMLILPDSDTQALAAVGDKIRIAVGATPVQLATAAISLPVTLSVGVAAFHPDADSGESLVARADHALYRAKQSGRNRVEIDP